MADKGNNSSEGSFCDFNTPQWQGYRKRIEERSSMDGNSEHFLLPSLKELRKNVDRATGLQKVNIDRLYRLVRPDPIRAPREVYDLHWPLIYLLEGGKEAREKAREAVLLEAIGGGPKARPGHAWDTPNFFRMHLWISAAMAAHIAVAMDWLAVEGLFTKKEIDQMGSHFVEGFRRYIYPHLKGKGRSPYFHEPINQDSAMVAGCLVIGYLFGTKWKRDPRARRMYNDALAQAGNLMWQSSPSGFDGDGFTYMRQIQPPVLTLISMVIHWVEGVDYYFTEYGPGSCSIAKFMEKLLRFTLPSGYSFPHGRYGYVTMWNHYSQAYAARRTGNALYLEEVIPVPQRRFITPWIAFDLPLAVAWAPYGTEPGAPTKAKDPPYLSWHDTALWSNIGSPQKRIQSHLCWRRGQHGTFILEHDRQRAVVLYNESAPYTNGLYFPGVRGTGKPGNRYGFLRMPSMQIDRIQLESQWDPAVILEYGKYVAVIEDGTVLALDTYRSSQPTAPVYSLTTPHKITRNTMTSEHGDRRVQVLSSVAFDTREEVAFGSKKSIRWTAQSGGLDEADRGFAATLFCFDKTRITGFRTKENGVSWRKDGIGHSVVLNPRYPDVWRNDTRHTDGVLHFHSGHDLVLFSVRRFGENHTSLWSTKRINLGHTDGLISIQNMAYGTYVRYTTRDLDISLLRGSGYDIYVAAASPVSLELEDLGPGGFIQINGRKARRQTYGDKLRIRIPSCNTHALSKKRKKMPSRVIPLTKKEIDSTKAITALDAVLTGHHTDRLEYVRTYLNHAERDVRLTAAEVLGYLGTADDALLIAERLTVESSLESEIGGLDGPWRGKWAFFPSVTVMADALRKLGNSEVVEALESALPQQTEPHAIGSIRLAIEVLKGCPN